MRRTCGSRRPWTPRGTTRPSRSRPRPVPSTRSPFTTSITPGIAPSPIASRSHRDRELGLQRIPVRDSRVVRVKEARTIVEPLTVDQVNELLHSLRRYRDLAIAYLMLLCGLRSQEVLNLRGADIDLEDRRLRVRGKGGKERAVPAPPTAPAQRHREVHAARATSSCADAAGLRQLIRGSDLPKISPSTGGGRGLIVGRRSKPHVTRPQKRPGEMAG